MIFMYFLFYFLHSSSSKMLAMKRVLVFTQFLYSTMTYKPLTKKIRLAWKGIFVFIKQFFCNIYIIGSCLVICIFKILKIQLQRLTSVVQASACQCPVHHSKSAWGILWQPKLADRQNLPTVVLFYALGGVTATKKTFVVMITAVQSLLYFFSSLSFLFLGPWYLYRAFKKPVVSTSFYLF